MSAVERITTLDCNYTEIVISGDTKQCHSVMFPHMATSVTFSMSETQDKEVPSSTSGAVKARRSCWVTYSSVKEMLPDGMSRRDQGEMMKPMAEGSAKGERNDS